VSDFRANPSDGFVRAENLLDKVPESFQGIPFLERGALL
jgi:hypothetical protein